MNQKPLRDKVSNYIHCLKGYADGVITGCNDCKFKPKCEWSINGILRLIRAEKKKEFTNGCKAIVYLASDKKEKGR